MAIAFLDPRFDPPHHMVLPDAPPLNLPVLYHNKQETQPELYHIILILVCNLSNFTEIRFRIFANQLFRIEIQFERVLSKLF